MPLFKYQARNRDGQIYERTTEAADRLALYSLIREEGGTPVVVNEVKKLSLELSLGSFLNGIKTQEKINFAKNLASMIDAGLSVSRALIVMEKQATRKPLKKSLSDIEAEVRGGSTLAEALARQPKVFSALFVSMVKAGEESGSVSQSLRIVATQMEKAYQLVKKVRGALIYPAVIIGVMIVLAILLLMYMVPTLTATFEGIGIELPLSTRILIALSDFLVNHTFIVISFLLLLVVGTLAFLRSVAGKNILDRITLMIPVIGTIAREVQVARVARTLSSLISAGVEIVAALGVTSEVLQNHLYKETLVTAQGAIQKGEALSGIFSRFSYLYPVVVSEMVAVGEETGKIADMLKGVADYYEDQVDQKTKDLSTIIEPILMVIIGAGVGLFAISMLAPTYSLVDYI